MSATNFVKVFAESVEKNIKSIRPKYCYKDCAFEVCFDTLNGLLLILWGIYKDMFKRSIQAIKWVLYDMFSCIEVRGKL